jgi:glycine C-acetyltransferase
MYGKVQHHLGDKIAEIRNCGLYKQERVVGGSQRAKVSVTSGAKVLNLCANNYLGLANHPAAVQAARQALHD